jgi:hypothetical protein
MSTVTNVRADNGGLYANPVVHGNGWFLEFPADEPPELVIAKFPDEPIRSVEARAGAILAGAGVSAVLIGTPRLGVRLFGRDRRSAKRLMAAAWTVDVARPIPARLLNRSALAVA